MMCDVTKSVAKSQGMFVGRPSQCIYRMIQVFFTHGILLCMVFIYGFLPILILGFFGPFWREWG